MKRYSIAVALLSIFALTGCVAPQSFVRSLDPTWASVELREEVTYEQGWQVVVNTLVKQFDLEVLSKDNGYLRTNWQYTWTGRLNERYRVRVTAKFSPDKKKLEMKSEAEFGGAGYWVQGYDTRLLSTLKTDIMGSIGRTTR